MFKKFKEKENCNKVCEIFRHFVFNTYYKLGLGVGLAIVFGILTNFVPEDSLAATIFLSFHFGGFAIILIITLIAMLYAWIINPIRGLKKKHGK